MILFLLLAWLSLNNEQGSMLHTTSQQDMSNADSNLSSDFCEFFQNVKCKKRRIYVFMLFSSHALKWIWKIIVLMMRVERNLSTSGKICFIVCLTHRVRLRRDRMFIFEKTHFSSSLSLLPRSQLDSIKSFEQHFGREKNLKKILIEIDHQRLKKSWKFHKLK